MASTAAALIWSGWDALLRQSSIRGSAFNTCAQSADSNSPSTTPAVAGNFSDKLGRPGWSNASMNPELTFANALAALSSETTSTVRLLEKETFDINVYKPIG